MIKYWDFVVLEINNKKVVHLQEKYAIIAMDKAEIKGKW